MSSILLNLIHQEALTTKPPIHLNAANYSIWVQHWFETAERIAADFDCRGLPETAKAVRDIIVEEKKLLGGRYENESASSTPPAR